jgi:ATP-dependent Lon protease
MSTTPKSNKAGEVTPSSKAKPGATASSGAPADDVFDLPAVAEDTILRGAAADAADLDAKFKDLPRILRVALLINRERWDIHERLVADIETLRPGLLETAAFATTETPTVALALAGELDRCAVADDEPELRHIADCVRLLSLPMQKDLANCEDYKRVTQTLMNTLARLPSDIDPQLGAEIESFCVGWAMIPSLKHRLPRYQRTGLVAANHARTLGDLTASRRVEAAEESIWSKIEARADAQMAKVEETDTSSSMRSAQTSPSPATGQPQRVVARLSDLEMKNTRLKELFVQFEGVINKPVPLVVTPPLAEVRKTLLFEFPYAQSVVDAVLADLVGRPTVLLRPTLVWGEPGAGKSLLVRRMAELLGVFCWRTDASRSDAVFAGTDRRWNSAEPCHPFLAIVRANHANPMILLDEFDKPGGAVARAPASGGIRSENVGRLWDCLLGMMEPETSSRYPDPLLQTEIDLSQLSFAATANSVAGLPSPLLDRMRVIKLDLPSPEHLDALLPAVIADLAHDRGLERTWISPLDGEEHAAIASSWRGGSVRHLRRLVEIILRDREANAIWN